MTVADCDDACTGPAPSVAKVALPAGKLFQRLRISATEVRDAFAHIRAGGRVAGDDKHDLRAFRASDPDNRRAVRAARRRCKQYVRDLTERLRRGEFTPTGGRRGTRSRELKVRSHVILDLDDHVVARVLLNRFSSDVWGRLPRTLVGGQPGASSQNVVRELAFALAKPQRAELILFDIRAAYASARLEDAFVALAQHGVPADELAAARALYGALPAAIFPGLVEGHPIAPLALATVLAPVSAQIELLALLARIYVDDGAVLVEAEPQSDLVVRLLRHDLPGRTGLQVHDRGSPKALRTVTVDSRTVPVHEQFTALGFEFVDGMPMPAKPPAGLVQGAVDVQAARYWLPAFDVGQPRRTWAEYSTRITVDFAAKNERDRVGGVIARFEEQRHLCRGTDREEPEPDTQRYPRKERIASHHARRATSPADRPPAERGRGEYATAQNPTGGPSRPSGREGSSVALSSPPLEFNEWRKSMLRLKPGELLGWIRSSARCFLSWGACLSWAEATAPWETSGCTGAAAFELCWLGAEHDRLWRLHRVALAVRSAFDELRMYPEHFVGEHEDPDYFGWCLPEELPVDFLVAASEILASWGQIRELLVRVVQLVALRRVPDEFGADVMRSVVHLLRRPKDTTRYLTLRGRAFALRYTSTEGREELVFDVPAYSSGSYPEWLNFQRRVWMGARSGGGST